MEETVSISQVILSLLFVCGLIGLSAFALKWFADKSLLVKQLGTGKRIKHTETCVLDAKHKIFMVECDGEEMLLASNGQSFELLKRQAKPEASNASQ